LPLAALLPRGTSSGPGEALGRDWLLFLAQLVTKRLTQFLPASGLAPAFTARIRDGVRSRILSTAGLS
jgi:hypothetical protein